MPESCSSTVPAGVASHRRYGPRRSVARELARLAPVGPGAKPACPMCGRPECPQPCRRNPTQKCRQIAPCAGLSWDRSRDCTVACHRVANARLVGRIDDRTAGQIDHRARSQQSRPASAQQPSCTSARQPEMSPRCHRDRPQMPPTAWVPNDGRCSERTGESASAAGSCASGRYTLSSGNPRQANRTVASGAAGQPCAEGPENCISGRVTEQARSGRRRWRCRRPAVLRGSTRTARWQPVVARRGHGLSWPPAPSDECTQPDCAAADEIDDVRSRRQSDARAEAQRSAQMRPAVLAQIAPSPEPKQPIDRHICRGRCGSRSALLARRARQPAAGWSKAASRLQFEPRVGFPPAASLVSGWSALFFMMKFS